MSLSQASMDLTPCLYHAGDLVDTPTGRKTYLEYLAWLSASDRAKKEQSFDSMCRGWALGTHGFKKDLVTEDRVAGAERLGKAYSIRCCLSSRSQHVTSNWTASLPIGRSWSLTI